MEEELWRLIGGMRGGCGLGARFSPGFYT
jgi:hypothetical protein